MGDPHLYGWFMEKYGNIWMVYNGKNEKKLLMVIIWRFPMGDPHLYGWFMEKYGNIWMVYNGKNEKKPLNGNNMEVSYGGSPFIWMVYGNIWKHMDGLQWKK